MRYRSILLLAFAGLIAVSGCASTQKPKPAVCDGKHRRPANPYGTVLPTVPLPTAGVVAPSAPTSMPNTPPGSAPLSAKPATTAGPGPMSSLDHHHLDKGSFDPCRRPA